MRRFIRETLHEIYGEDQRVRILAVHTSTNSWHARVSLGNRGGRIHLRGQGSFPYAPAPVRRVEDPTGAGDVFLAAYLAARLAAGRPPRAAARGAAQISARQIEGGWLEASLLALDPS